MLMEVNEYLLAHKDDDSNNNTPPSSGNLPENDTNKEDTNKGTLTLDATCAPADIRYPQDISLLNEAREKLETIIYRFCKSYGLPLPRRYSRRARKDYLAFAKSKKHSAKKIRKALRKQLGYVARDIRYLEQFMGDGYAMVGKETGQYLTIITLYGQQKYMYDNKVHSVLCEVNSYVKSVPNSFENKGIWNFLLYIKVYHLTGSFSTSQSGLPFVSCYNSALFPQMRCVFSTVPL